VTAAREALEPITELFAIGVAFSNRSPTERFDAMAKLSKLVAFLTHR
jgi:hypothetical protein